MSWLLLGEGVRQGNVLFWALPLESLGGDLWVLLPKSIETRLVTVSIGDNSGSPPDFVASKSIEISSYQQALLFPLPSGLESPFLSIAFSEQLEPVRPSFQLQIKEISALAFQGATPPPASPERLVPALSGPTTPSPFVVSESSSTNSDLRGWRLFDRSSNDSAGRWLSHSGNVQNQWVSIDFGGDYTVSRVQLSVAIVPARFPRDYRIEFSYNGADWENALRVTDSQMNGANQATPAIDFLPRRSRYWRLFVERNWGDSAFISVKEMSLWGYQ